MVLHCFALLIEKEDKDILRQIQGSGIRDSIPCPERYKEIQRFVSTSRCLLVFYAEISPLYHSISIQIFWVVVFAIHRRDQTDGWLATTSYWDLNGRPKIPQWSLSGSGKRSWWQRYLRTVDLNTKHMFVMNVIIALWCWILLGLWDIMMPHHAASSRNRNIDISLTPTGL